MMMDLEFSLDYEFNKKKSWPRINKFPIDKMDKNKIDVTVYEIDKNTLFFTYTALWCPPCQKIKPKLIEIMTKYNYKVLSQGIIEKTLFKEMIGEFVPFFIIKKKNRNYTDSIQTSDETLLKQFLSKNEIGTLVIDEDF